MKAYPAIYCVTACLLTVIASVSAGLYTGQHEMTYLTVKHGSMATMTCRFPEPNPRSVTWKRGEREGFISIGDEDFFVLGYGSTTGLHDADYRLELGEMKSTLVINSTDIQNPKHAKPYVCEIGRDGYEEWFMLAIVRDDLKCRFVEAEEKKKNDDVNDNDINERRGSLRVGAKAEIECSVTKDRLGSKDRLDFILFIGDEEIEWRVTERGAIWGETTILVTRRFSFNVSAKFQGQKVRVELKLDNEDNLKAIVDTNLSLSYGMELWCPPCQRFVKPNLKGSTWPLATSFKAMKERDNGKERCKLPSPRCWVMTLVPVESETWITWRLAGSSSSDNETHSQVLGSYFVNLPEYPATHYLLTPPQSFIDSLLASSNDQLDIVVSISELDSSLLVENFTIPVNLAPQIFCGFHIPPVKLGSANVSKFQGLFCLVYSRPRIEDIQITADSSVQLLQPQFNTSTISTDDPEDYSDLLIVDITFPNASSVPIDQVAREFASPNPARKESVWWVAHILPTKEKVNPDLVDPPPTVSTTIDPVDDQADATGSAVAADDQMDATGSTVAADDQANATVSADAKQDQANATGDATVLTNATDDQADVNLAVAMRNGADSIEGKKHHNESKKIVQRQVQEGDANATSSRVKRYKRAVLKAVNKKEDSQNSDDKKRRGNEEEERDGNGDDNAQKDGQDVRRKSDEEEPRANASTKKKFERVSKVSPIQFKHLPLKKDGPVAHFKAAAVYRVGGYQRTYDFQLPAVRLTFDSALVCDTWIVSNSTFFQFSCYYLEKSFLDLKSIVIFADVANVTSMNGTLAGVIDRTPRGFDVTGVYSGNLKAIDHKRLVLVVRVKHADGSSDDARVLIDFSHARAPSCPARSRVLSFVMGGIVALVAFLILDILEIVFCPKKPKDKTKAENLANQPRKA